MATYRPVTVDIPESQRLFDLTGVCVDLESCSQYCRKILDKGITGDSEAYFISAIILYGRALRDGVRNLARPPIDIKGVHIPISKGGILTEKEYETHTNVLNMRSKHIAHSINSMENQVLYVWLNPEERGKKVNNVNCVHGHYAAFSGDYCSDLIAVCSKINEWIKSEIKAEEVKLKDIVINRFTLDYLYSLDVKTPEHGDLKDVGKGRSRKK